MSDTKPAIEIHICRMPSVPGFEDDPLASHFILQAMAEEDERIKRSPHGRRTGLDDIDDQCYGGPEESG